MKFQSIAILLFLTSCGIKENSSKKTEPNETPADKTVESTPVTQPQIVSTPTSSQVTNKPTTEVETKSTPALDTTKPVVTEESKPSVEVKTEPKYEVKVNKEGNFVSCQYVDVGRAAGCTFKEVDLFSPLEKAKTFTIKFLYHCDGHKNYISFLIDGYKINAYKSNPEPQELTFTGKSAKPMPIDDDMYKKSFRPDCEFKILGPVEFKD